ncbi:MAG: alpha/beta hydrolase [Burkholderiales bacterium]
MIGKRDGARAPERAGERAYLSDLAAHAGIDARGVDPPFARRIDIDGLGFRYLEWGDPHAPALVLLHGGGQTAHTWDACCLILARRYRCIALEARGHGDSDWSRAGAYAIEDHARDIAGFVDRLALDLPIVAGMSMGGINATAYAVLHAERMRALVSIDVGPEVQFEPVERLMRGMNEYRRFDSPRHAAERLSRLGARRATGLLERTLSRNLRQEDDGTWTWKYDPRPLLGLSTHALLAPRKRLWDVIDRITCPALVVRGGDSEIFSDADAAKFAGALPQGTLVRVPRARHSVQTDNPRGLAEAIVAFDDGLPARNPERSSDR